MKVLVTTCNRYLPLLPSYAKLFNKHWSTSQEVLVLCYDKPSFKLPDNFTCVSLGKEDGYYSNGLIRFFETFEEECFILTMEDHFLVNDINTDLMTKAEYEITNNGVDKVMLGCWDGNKRCTRNLHYHGNTDYSEDFFSWKSSGAKLYMGSWLHPPCMFSLKWMKKILKPNLVFHKFECTTKELEKEMLTRNERPLVLHSKNGMAYVTLDAVRNGKFNDPIFRYYKEDPKGYIGENMHFGDPIDEEDINTYREAKLAFEAKNDN